MKKKYRFLRASTLTEPTYEYASGKGEGCTREANYFEDFDTINEAEKELAVNEYKKDNYEDLLLITVYVTSD